MSETKKSAGERLQDAAEAVTKFWADGFLEGKTFKDFLHDNGEFNQGELKPDTFIHPQDVAFLKNEAAPKDKRLATLRSWVNGYEGEKLKEFQADDAKALPLYPAVPQPFMGDLSDPRLLVVTMNPGFHEYSDWVMGRPFSALPWKTRGKLHYRIGDLYGFNPSDNTNEKSQRVRKQAREQWKQEQEKLLRHIRGETIVVPWSMHGRSPDFAFCPPLNCHGDGASFWGKKKQLQEDPEQWPLGKHNWHTTYFGTPGDETYLRSLIPQKEREKTTSDLVAQVELHPYASKTGEDLKKLLHPEDFELNVSDQNADYGCFLPSQRPILEYVRTFMETAEERNAIVVFRGSVFGKNGVQWLDSTIISSESAKTRCFYRGGQGFSLTISESLKNRATDQSVKKSDLQKLLQTQSI